MLYNDPWLIIVGSAVAVGAFCFGTAFGIWKERRAWRL